MKFILFHGSFGSPEGNWFPELKNDLEILGQVVIAPKFPVDDWDEMVKNGPNVPLKNQSLDHWLDVFRPIAASIKKDEKVCFVGHSLGPLFILHVVNAFNIQLDSAIFVSPFLDSLDRWEFNNANKTFYKTDFDFEKLKKLIPVSYVLYSDNDPYVAKQHSLLFANALDASTILVRRAGHMNSSVNLNEFPLVRDLCCSRLDLSLYQQFLEHYKKQSAQDYITSVKDRGNITLKPQDVVDEGIFHFRHLMHDGFCTLYTGIKNFWDPNSVYMNNARAAATRVTSFVRVVVVENIQDLQKSELQEQIRLDIAAGIQMYVCMYDDIRQIVQEPDFGIWDNDYVCVVRNNPDTQEVEEAELNSKTNDVQKYQEWREYILKHAVEIRDPKKDIAAFIDAHSTGAK
jgi:uncharacterized protein